MERLGDDLGFRSKQEKLNYCGVMLYMFLETGCVDDDFAFLHP